MGSGSLRSPAILIIDPGWFSVSLLLLQPVSEDDLKLLGAVQGLAALTGVVAEPDFDAGGDAASRVLFVMARKPVFE